MTAGSISVLFASRAYESPHTEGGFLILKDLARRAALDETLRPACFSTAKQLQSAHGIELLPGMSRTGWGLGPSLQFARAMRRDASRFDIVHTAHVPTVRNSRVLARLRRRASGTRFVQTITALPKAALVRPGLFWGDTVACLNESVATVARKFHDNVLVVPPVPSPQRLQQRSAMPEDMTSRLSGRKVVAIAADLSRVSDQLDVRAVCETLLHARPDLVVVFACRFGEERLARELLGRLPEAFADRVHVFGEIDWILDLLARDTILLYPVDDLAGKFDPPLVLLEAAALGARVVTNHAVQLGAAIDTQCAQLVSSENSDAWASAVLEAIESGQCENCSLVPFEETYLKYQGIYQTLWNQSEP